jgi:hypothetical protein
MRFEDLIPHLNKISTLYLTNNRRRVGWLFSDSASNKSQEEIYFINVIKGRKMLESPQAKDLERLEKVREKIPVSEIIRVRSIDF